MPYLSSTDTVLEHRWKMLLSLGIGMIVVLIVLIIPFIPALTFSSGSKEKSQAMKEAKSVYEHQQAAGVSFANGQCIAESLMPDWVADIVHNPRDPMDDLPENQCQSYRAGSTHHFVELDLQGNIIRAQ